MSKKHKKWAPIRLQPGETRTVVLPKLFPILGVIFALLGSLAVFGATHSEDVALGILFGLLVLAGVAMVVGYLNCRIRYDEDGFTSKTFWGIKRRIAYDEITGLRFDGSDTIFYIEQTVFRRDGSVYIKDLRVRVDDLGDGGIEFLLFAEQKYGERFHQTIPEIMTSKFDIFKGNVRSPEGFIFSYVLMLVCIVGMMTVMAVTTFSDDSDRIEDFQAVACAFAVREGDGILTTVEGTEFSIDHLPEDYDLSPIEAVCDGKTPLLIRARWVGSGEDRTLRLRALIAEGQTILSEEETKDFFTAGEMKFNLLMSGVILGFWGILVGSTVFAGRNADKYPWLARLLFKESYLR